MAKLLQLLRSNSVYANKSAAIEALQGLVNSKKDGEPVLARYYDTEGADTVVKSIMGIYHVQVPLDGEGTKQTGVTILEDASDIENILNGLDFSLTQDDNKIVTDVDQTNGLVSASSANITTIKLAGYAEADSAAFVATTDTLGEALGKLQKQIDVMDASSVADNNKVVTDVTQTNGVVTATASNITGVKLDGYTVGADNSGKVASTDTLGQALGKLQGQINGMDLTEVGGTSGDVITAVSEADGKVSATKSSLSDVLLTGYAKTSDTGAIAATDSVEVALSKIENKIAANTVSSDDKTVIVTPDANGDTDLAVNIDGTTLVKNSSTGVISSGLTIQSISQGESSTYASQYKLVDANGTQIGTTINIAKDQFLKEASYDASTQTLTLTMYNATGGTTDIEVDFSDAVIETEAGQGLYVGTGAAAGSINVGIDQTSEAVTISDGNGGSTTASVLTVSADAIKVNNIQAAINYAISTLDTSDTAVAGQYISQVVETDGILTITRANVSEAVLTNYAKGTKPSTTAVAATDTVNGAIAKLEHHIDDVQAASATVVTEGTDTGNNMTIVETTDATDGHKVYTVNLTDVASATEVDAIETAVGLNTDGTKATVTGEYTASASTVEGEIDALDDELQKALKHVTGSNAISTGNATASTQAAAKDQTISLILDSTTATTDQTCTGTNALQITSDGLFLSSVWDCGTY